MNRLTDARLEAPRNVVAGKIRKERRPDGSVRFQIAGFWQMPRQPRALTQDEVLILEPEEQLQHLQHEMDRTMPRFVLPITRTTRMIKTTR